MKKLLFFLLGIGMFFSVSLAQSIENLYTSILNNGGIYTKKSITSYFCKQTLEKSDIFSRSKELDGDFDPKKSVFLYLLCNTSGIYDKAKFSFKEIKLNKFFEDDLKKAFKGTGYLYRKCRLYGGYNTQPGSLNDLNLACVSKYIFDKLINDEVNLYEYKLYGAQKDLKGEGFKQWQLSYFGTNYCNDGAYIYNDQDGNTPSACSHPKVYKILKDFYFSLNNIYSNLEVFDFKNDDEFNDFLKSTYGGSGNTQTDIYQKAVKALYNELYFYNLYLTFYKTMLKAFPNQLNIVYVGNNLDNAKLAIASQIIEADQDIKLSQFVLKQTLITLTNIYRSWPIHVAFLALMEDLQNFRHALAKIYTPLDQLRYKLQNVQDLDKQ